MKSPTFCDHLGKDNGNSDWATTSSSMAVIFMFFSGIFYTHFLYSSGRLMLIVDIALSDFSNSVVAE